jgi:hypothetical protein
MVGSICIEGQSALAKQARGARSALPFTAGRRGLHAPDLTDGFANGLPLLLLLLLLLLPSSS